MELRFVKRWVRWDSVDGPAKKAVRILQFREKIDDGQSYWSDWKDIPEVDEE